MKIPENFPSLYEMEIAIAQFYEYRRNIIVPNISWGIGIHECDILVIRSTGYCLEIEIKRSKSDTIADLKKEHHHKDGRISGLLYAFPDELIESCRDLIPENAGILSIYRDKRSKKFKAKLIKKEKRNINCRKLDTKEMLRIAHLGTMRIYSLKEKIVKMENCKK
jgi:hypothetical protein